MLYYDLWNCAKDPLYGNSSCWNWPCGPVGIVSHPSYLSDPNASSLPEPAAGWDRSSYHCCHGYSHS